MYLQWGAVIEVCTSQPVGSLSIDQARCIQNVGELQELTGFTVARVTGSAGGKSVQDDSSALGCIGVCRENIMEDVPHRSLS